MQPWNELPLRYRRVLLVQDCPDDQRRMARALTQAGSDVILECRGEAAISRVRHAAATDRGFDLVVIDLQLQGGDAIETTRRLRAMGCQTPVLAITAHGEQAARFGNLDGVGVSLLCRPLASDSLVSAAHQALQHLETACLPRVPCP